MKPKLKIRAATLNDAKTIFAIQNRNYQESFCEGESVIGEIIEKYPEGCFVIEHNKLPVGYLLSHPGKFYHLGETEVENSGKNYLGRDMCLDREFRTGNMFKELHGFLEENAKSKGFKWFYAVVVNTNRKKYQTAGFESLGEVWGGNGSWVRKKIL